MSIHAGDNAKAEQSCRDYCGSIVDCYGEVFRSLGFDGPLCSWTRYGGYAVFKSMTTWVCVAWEPREGGTNVKFAPAVSANKRLEQYELAGAPYYFAYPCGDFLTELSTVDPNLASKISELLSCFTDLDKQDEADRLFAQAIGKYAHLFWE